MEQERLLIFFFSENGVSAFADQFNNNTYENKDLLNSVKYWAFLKQTLINGKSTDKKKQI